MGILGMVRAKMAQARGTRRLHQQVAAEMKAKSLEDKAKHAKDLRKKLERQEKARAEIQKTKKMKRAVVKRKVGAVISGLSKIKKHLPKGKGMGFGGGAFGDTGKDVFSGTGKIQFGLKPKK